MEMRSGTHRSSYAFLRGTSYRNPGILSSHTRTHACLNEFHLLPTHSLFFFFYSLFLQVDLVSTEIMCTRPLSGEGARQSVRGIFCLTGFHLQSGDVTFVWGNEIAPQQDNRGYIIPGRPHILPPQTLRSSAPTTTPPRPPSLSLSGTLLLLTLFISP